MAVRISKDSYILFDNKPAYHYEEAYPIGNGTIGAMMYGGTDIDEINLNHDELWTGYPRNNEFRGGKYEALKEIKKLVLEDKLIEAEKLTNECFGNYACESFLPLCKIYIKLYETGKYSKYKRYLDLKNAEFSSSYELNGKKYSKNAFVSFVDKALIYKIECENGLFSLEYTLSTSLKNEIYTSDENGNYLNENAKKAFLIMKGECPINSEQNLERTERFGFYKSDIHEKGILTCGAFTVKTDGKLSTAGDIIRVNDASYSILIFSAETSYNGYDKHPYLEGKDYITPVINRLENVYNKDYFAARNAHIKDYSRYYNRVKLNIGSSNKSNVPLPKRLEEYYKGSEDKSLPILLFNFGRYLTIAGSRKGSQPLNLQGIWNTHLMPPWHSDYTVNINTQMNYYPTLSCNLKEMYEPLLKMIKELSVAGKITAKELYNANGWVCHHNTDIWRHTKPVVGLAQYLFFNGAGGWLCHHVYDYFEYTGDIKYLKNEGFEIMLGAAEFYLSQLVTSEYGDRIIFPSTSPENTYICKDEHIAVSKTTEMTMAIVRELFCNCIKAADLLNN